MRSKISLHLVRASFVYLLWQRMKTVPDRLLPPFVWIFDAQHIRHCIVNKFPFLTLNNSSSKSFCEHIFMLWLQPKKSLPHKRKRLSYFLFFNLCNMNIQILLGSIGFNLKKISKRYIYYIRELIHAESLKLAVCCMYCYSLLPTTIVQLLLTVRYNGGI